MMHHNIQESLSIRSWSTEDLPTTSQEQAIYDNWQIQLQTLPSSKVKLPKIQASASSWTPPPINVFQLNFDGASKGNLGSTGYGGLIRNHLGKVLITFFSSTGWNTNNVAELEGLWRGLQIAQKYKHMPLIVEGDSQILINIATKLQQGTSVHKVSSSWRLATRLESLKQWLENHPTISFKHIRREGNKPVDLMANLGVEREKDFFEGPLQSIASETEISTFQSLLIKDMQARDEFHPDAGDSPVI